jgi:hypothetical protein
MICSSVNLPRFITTVEFPSMELTASSVAFRNPAHEPTPDTSLTVTNCI